MAERLKLKVSDILDRDAHNIAVRMALVETQIIEETRKFLEAVGAMH